MRLWTDVGLNPKSISAEMHTESRMVSLHVGKQEGDLPASITMTFEEWDIFAQRIQSEHERLETERSAPRHTDKNGKAIIHESTD